MASKQLVWQRYLQHKRARKRPRDAARSKKRPRKAKANTKTICGDTLWLDLRMIQRKTSCSNSTIMAVAKSVLPTFSKGIQMRADKKLTIHGGAIVMELHGCVHCHKFVFLPSSRSRQCPKCGGARYDDLNRPNEVCTYFPLQSQLAKLLSLPSFRSLLKHEYERPKNSAFMSDVYDAPIWLKRFGPPNASPTRIVLQLCVDGVPAFAIKHSLSLKPVALMNLSFAPKLRVQASNMLLLMLIPASLKGQAAKKYYDFAADFELNALHDRGVEGVKVMLFGNTMDTPGRAELLNMQVVSCVDLV